MIAQLLGWIATILFTVMLVPQIVKTVTSGTVKGVSLGMYIIALIANIIAICYAILIKQPPLLIKYILALIITLLYIGIFLRTKGKESVTYKQ